MKKPVIARQRVTVIHETPIDQTGPNGEPMVLRHSESFFVYDGEEGVDLANRTVKLGQEHPFVQRESGVLTPFGAMEMRAHLETLGWEWRELAARAGVNAGACRDALLMTCSATNTYPKMLAAVRVGLDAMARLEAQKAKAA